jgi:hypothetical protein
MTSEAVHATLGPSLCLVAQGAKVVMLGREVFEYDAARMLVFAVDLPVSGQVTRASWREPFLGFKLDLDPPRVAELAARVYPRRIPKPSEGAAVGRATDAIVDAVARLFDLMAQAEDASPDRSMSTILTPPPHPTGSRAPGSTAEVRRAPYCRSSVVDTRALRATRDGR